MKSVQKSTSHPLRRITCTLLFAAALAAGIGVIASSRAVDSPKSPAQLAAAKKIASWVDAHTQDGKQAEFIVVLNDQADLSGAAAMKTKAEKGRFVRDALYNKSKATQGPILKMIEERGLEHRAFYIVNAIWVKGRAEDVMALAERADVARVEGNPEVRNYPNPLPSTPAADPDPDAPATVEQGIAYTNAPAVWATGFLGQGVVVADGDTGFRWTHNAIKPHYRGWNGVTADHNYNWHDAIHTGGGICGPDSPQPCDDSGHGSHTMGTAIGDDGGGNQIGMAPAAKCIGCRNMDQGVGTPARYMECFEFFLAPYPIGGTTAQGDPSKAPDLTTNSWECPASEGCSATTLQATVEAQRAAGIMCVVAAQNSGPSCSTVQNPPGIYDAAYSIGALNNGTDTIASFSSRGPVTADGSNRMKPDLSAPGTNVRSAYNSSDSAYAFLSGTSMATPHVAGAVALLWSAHPELLNDITSTENILNSSAHHILTSECTGPTPVTPNNVYGNGRLDILAAVNSVQVDSVVITAAQYVTARSQLTVKATDSNSTATLTVSVTSSGVVLGTLRGRGDGTYSGKFNGISNPVNITVTSSLGGTASAAVRVR